MWSRRPVQKKKKKKKQANQLIENALATATYATQCAGNSTLQNSPGSIEFQRDILIDVPLISDLFIIHDRRQDLVDENLRRQNAKRSEHHSVVGDQILHVTYVPTKLQEKLQGPYPIAQVHTNGTVEIMRTLKVRDRVRLGKIIPFRG